MEKNSISLLQEYCAQNKHKPPLYEELAPERTETSTIFKYKVQINLFETKYEAIGTGLNKKSAKQSAASDLCGKLGLKSQDLLSDSGYLDNSLCLSMKDLSFSSPEKTPVSLLQEFCAKNKVNDLQYEEFPSKESGMFKCKAIVTHRGEKKDASGTGLSKKSAKHSAAQCLLDLLGLKYDWNSEIDQDSVSALKTLCEKNNYCHPVYEDVQVTGPSHCPEFTIRCSVAKLVKEAAATSKKLAKQKVSTDMIRTINESTPAVLEKLQVALKQPEMFIKEESYYDEITNSAYRKYKNPSYKKQFTNNVGERHDSLINHIKANSLTAVHREFISTKHPSLREKIEKTLAIAGLDYEVKVVPFHETPMMSFEIKNIKFDCYFFAFQDEFWLQVAHYLIVMLDIPIRLSEILENFRAKEQKYTH